MCEDTANATIVEQPNSCEISVNGKGEISFKVKAYANTISDACEEAWVHYEITRDRVQAEKGKAAKRPGSAA